MNIPYFTQIKPGYFHLYLKVKAGAKSDNILGFIEINKTLYLKISIKQIPEKGKANAAIIKFFSNYMDLPNEAFEIIQGSRNSFKILLIKNIDYTYLKNKFDSYINNYTI